MINPNSSFAGDDFLNEIINFEIMKPQVKYIIPYNITNGLLETMRLNCNSPPSLELHISSADAGVLTLDLPLRMIDGIHSVRVNEHDLDNVSIDGNVLEIHFPTNTKDIDIFGSYYLNSNDDGICDVFHNPPYSYILPPSKQISFDISPSKIICKDNLELIFKFSDGSPACVESETKIKLIERGWTKST